MSFVKQPDGSYIEAGKEASIISGKVVDDTKDFGVSATGAPAPPEVVCSSYTIESTCTAAGCHWYDGKCHSKVKKPEEVEIPWAVIIAAVGGAVVLFGVALAIKR